MGSTLTDVAFILGNGVMSIAVRTTVIANEASYELESKLLKGVPHLGGNPGTQDKADNKTLP